MVGSLGADPDIRQMQNGDAVANLSIATSESWKDKSSGERREKTEWHKVVVFNQGLINVCQNYLRKGSKVYIEGQLETRSWEQDGQKKYTTEVVLRPYRSELAMLDGKPSGGDAPYSEKQDQFESNGGSSRKAYDDFEDEIPF